MQLAERGSGIFLPSEAVIVRGLPMLRIAADALGAKLQPPPGRRGCRRRDLRSDPGLATDEQLVRKAGIQVRVVSDGTRKVPAVDELVVNGQPHQCGSGELTPRQPNCLLQRTLASERGERAFDALVISGNEVDDGEVLVRDLPAADSDGRPASRAGEMFDKGAVPRPLAAYGPGTGPV